MEKKLLIVCGPTATGKTSLSLELAKKFNGELISADSRQVYLGMDIGTGKDLPKNSNFQFSIFKEGKKTGYYEIDGIKLWGYDLVSPLEEFSVSHYSGIIQPIIKDIWERGKLPILVGGTGFYIRAIVDGIETMHIPSDQLLRNELSSKSIDQLSEKLHLLDPIKAASLNHSDRKNPARLIRAIEIAYWKRSPQGRKQLDPIPDTSTDTLFIGLMLERQKLFERIADRVVSRVDNGIKEEIESLLITDVSWEHQSMKTLGYREWQAYFEGSKTEHEVILEWIHDEQNYAKRQMTWFKKDTRIQWFDISGANFKKDVENTVSTWHTKRR